MTFITRIHRASFLVAVIIGIGLIHYSADAQYIGCYMDSQWTYDVPGTIYNGGNPCDYPDRECTPEIPDPCCPGAHAIICVVTETYNQKDCLGCIAKSSAPINVNCGNKITCTEMIVPTAASGWAVCDIVTAPCYCTDFDYGRLMREMRLSNQLKRRVYEYTCDCVAGTCNGQQIWP